MELSPDHRESHAPGGEERHQDQRWADGILIQLLAEQQAQNEHVRDVHAQRHLPEQGEWPGDARKPHVAHKQATGCEKVTTFEVRVSIDNPGGELKANMTANAEILLEEHKKVLTVPEQAVLYDKDRNASVEVPDPKTKTGRRKVDIKAGISNGTKTEILAGLQPGDTVILQQ